jgi:hypothetical protein
VRSPQSALPGPSAQQLSLNTRPSEKVAMLTTTDWTRTMANLPARSVSGVSQRECPRGRWLGESDLGGSSGRRASWTDRPTQ